MAASLVFANVLVGGGSAVGIPSLLSIPFGRSYHAIWSGNVARTFHTYRPRGVTDPVPMVVVLHGGYGNGGQAEQDYHWDAMADSGRFVVVAPDGLAVAWNAGGCCGLPETTHTDDVGFITTLVGAVEGATPIDPRRVYVTGMSNGAMMSLRLGCQTTIFAAIAPVAGTQVADCSSAQPTSVLQIHGTADDRVPYNGGPGKTRTLAGAPAVNGPSIPAVNADWRSRDGCGAPASTTAGDVTTSIAACPGGRTVELISIDGAGHQWPGGSPSPVLAAFGLLPAPSTVLNATATIWGFFSQHTR